MPNNGTLRLPLSPIGLHDPDSEGSGVETPPDPVEFSTYTSSAVSSSTPLINEPSSSPSQPAASSSSALSSTETPSTPTDATLRPPDPTPTDSIGDEDDDDENFSETHSFWDWLTDKISDAWDKITGSG